MKSNNKNNTLAISRLVRLQQLLTGLPRVNIAGETVCPVLSKRDKTFFIHFAWLVTWSIFSTITICKYIEFSTELGVNALMTWKIGTTITIFRLYFPVCHTLLSRKLCATLCKVCQELRINTNVKSCLGTIDYTDLGLFLVVVTTLVKVINHHSLSFYWDFYIQAVPGIIGQLDIIFWTKVSNYLRIRVNVINMAAKNFVKRKSKNISRVTANNVDLRNMLYTLERTFHGHELLVQILKLPLLVYFLAFFYWTLVSIAKIAVEFKKTKTVQFHNDLITIISNGLLVIIISIYSELFYKELDGTRKLCLRILDLYGENSNEYECAKQILWMMEEIPPTINILGTFKLNAFLPFRFLTPMFTITLVVFQFILL